jgi:RNA polymerase sigma factor (sigma-70 family)
VEAISAARPHGLRLPKPRRVLAALPDDRLAERVRVGDTVAFEILYDRHHRGVLGFCRHMLRSADEAEDAVQHAFIAAYNDLQRGDERDIRFKPWLYTIARNRCLSVLRARREQASDDLEITTDRLSDDVQNRADLQTLLADIGELPDDQREALVLSEVGDLSHAEVAGVIGCEVAKVKSLVFQARSALIERREARETPCSEIREQLATLRGGALRRSHLRHHLKDCPGCQQYREEVRRQRQMLALALPVIPSVALRHNVLAAIGGGGAAAGGSAAAGGLGVAAKAGFAKVGIAALVATAGVGTAVVATHSNLPIVGHDSGSSAPGSHAGSTPASSNAAVGQSTAAAAAATHAVAAHSTTAGHHHGRSASGTAHGFTPVRGGSNGAAARQFALTRGKGKHLGITKTHHTATHVKTVRTRRHTHSTPVRRRSTAAPRRTQTVPTTTSPTTTSPTTTTESGTPTSTTPTPSGGGGGKGSTGAGLNSAGGLKAH